MRDEMDGRLWVENHDSLVEGLDELAGGVRSLLNRLAGWDGTTHQLLAFVVAFLITTVTFKATVI